MTRVSHGPSSASLDAPGRRSDGENTATAVHTPARIRVFLQNGPVKPDSAENTKMSWGNQDDLIVNNMHTFLRIDSRIVRVFMVVVARRCPPTLSYDRKSGWVHPLGDVRCS